MIIDGYLLLDSASNVLTTNLTSSNAIDLQNARDMGVGDDPAVKFVCMVNTRFTSSSSASTLQVQIISSAAADLSSPTVLAESSTFSAAQMDALPLFQRLFDIDWPRSRGTLQRYVGARYIVGGPVAWSAGALTTMFVLDRDDIVLSYPPGIVISN